MTTAAASHVRLTIGSLIALTIVVLLFNSPARAQTFTSVTDGSTPSALTPGAPAGSYAFSSFENVNLYNGNLNFALPLVRVGGRGGADFTMMLTLEQHWRIRKPKPAPNCELTGTCDLRFPWPSWWGVMNPDYGPGVLQGRKPGVKCGDLSLTRLTFSAPGNTEFELRDQTTNGQPLAFTCGAAQGASRGTVFVTSDGSAATFVSDTTIFDTASENSTTFTPSGYDDVNRIITTTSDLNDNNDNLLMSKVLYDGFGRTTESRMYEGGANYIVTQRQYDGFGRVFKTSNPFRPWQSENALWSTKLPGMGTGGFRDGQDHQRDPYLHVAGQLGRLDRADRSDDLYALWADGL